MKRIISALLCVIIVIPSIISAAALRKNEGDYNINLDREFVVGDANGDSEVNMVDSLDTKKACAGLMEVDSNAGDINCDGIVNAKDLLVLKKCNAGIDDLANYENNATIDSFTIAGNDISEYSIVYHDDAKYVENNYYAADTFRKFINISTGINLNVGTEAVTEHKIEFVDVTKIEGMEEKLFIENYLYEVVDGDLYIYGTRRGAMYAVYELAENYLGLRFYSDRYTTQYADRYSEIEEGINVFHDPYLEFRICRQSFWRNDEAHYFPNRLNGTQHGSDDVAHGTRTGPVLINAHSFGYYYKMATGAVDVVFTGSNYNDYRAKYEAGVQKDEYAWNPCFTSDEEYATLFRGMLETMRYVQGWNTFREHTAAMSFSICDNRVVCSCRSCAFIMNTGDDRGKERLGCGEAGLNLYLANRACRDIVEYYPGRAADIEEYGDGEFSDYGYGEAIKDEYPFMRVYTILYDHTLPHELLLTDDRYEAIRPADNLIIMFCGNPCNNHFMGSGDCGDNLNILTLNGQEDAEAFAAWGDVTKVTGSDMWFWYYPVNYNTYVSDSPNVFNIWHDFKYVIEECNVTGIYYEGASRGYLFENLKAHLAAVFMWSMVEDEEGNVSYMSYDEFIEEMKAWLKSYYGKGWEYIYEYICMQDEAGNRSGICYINNCDYPGDMFEYEYMRDNYEYMRELAVKALALAETTNEIQSCEFVLMNCEVMGLSAVHKSWYTSEDATEEHKALFEERYTWLFNFLKNERFGNDELYNDNYIMRIQIGSSKEDNFMDTIELDFNKSPLDMLYGGGTWRKALDDKWVWQGSTPVWGYYG